MAHLPIEFCRRVAVERRAKGLTQSALARRVGCAQSAVSMFESGHPEKLSMEFVRKAAEILDIPLEERKAITAESLDSSVFSKKGYCPNAACLSNIPSVINGVPVVWPTLSAVGELSRYCKVCGEVLESSCTGCGGPVKEGAFCSVCGEARITAIMPPGVSAEDWVKQRRADILQWRELTQF